MAGYSKTPLIKKLGIKEGFKIRVIHPPPNYYTLLGELPESVSHAKTNLNFIHLFSNDALEVEEQMNILQKDIVSNGMMWFSWYKKSSRKQRNVNEDFIRNTALALGLVDVKVCAIDEEWSALKIVIRKENR